MTHTDLALGEERVVSLHLDGIESRLLVSAAVFDTVLLGRNCYGEGNIIIEIVMH